MTVRIYEATWRRASYPLWLRYQINKFELRILFSLSAYFGRVGRDIVPMESFIDSMTRNIKEKRKITGYLVGCLRRGFIGSYEYIRRPGSMCIGISDLGLKVMAEYEIELAKLEVIYKPQPSTVDMSLYIEKKLAA